MKTLSLIRHGAYDPLTGHLSDAGERQIAETANVLLKTLGEDASPTIFFSVKERAKQSAGIIADIFSTTAAEHPCLGFFDDAEAVRKARQLVEEQADTDNLILVSHEEQVNGLPPVFMQEHFGTDISSLYIEKGHGVVIDCAYQKMIPV